MPPKRPAMSSSVAKKTRKSLTLKVKLDIIHRHERGEKTNSIASHHGLTPSTVYHFKSADSIKKAVVASQWEVSLPNIYSSPSRVTSAEVPLLQPLLTTNWPSILIIFLGLTGLGCRLPLPAESE
ncbi:hypothetical protein E2C01_060169 [Portunus trituberculatus]|uniref:HTH psq-type domain-containing protein n=1 Tax=Portunus trituberculatus TaxID=210409 RepID=A0A5B7H9Q7_PORTR|nr:hypothetical protein [Portunus trituberculatus]